MARQSLTLIEASGTSKLGLERETGFEPATDGLGSRCATTALLPPAMDLSHTCTMSVKATYHDDTLDYVVAPLSVQQDLLE